MDTRKILVANSYIIGTAIIVFGFGWMISLAIVGGSFVQVMIAFSLTLTGILFWWLGYHYNAKMKLRLNIPNKGQKNREKRMRIENR